MGGRNVWLCAVLMAVAGSARAETYTWTAGYRWSEGAWAPNTPAAGGGAGTALVFAGANEWATENDLGEFALTSLDFASGTGSISGSKLIFTAAGETLPTIHADLLSVLAAPIELAADTVVTADKEIQFNAAISGPGALRILNTAFDGGGKGWVYLNRGNTLEGGVDLLQGHLIVNRSDAFGTGPVCVTNDARSLLTILGDHTFANPFHIGSEQSNGYNTRLNAQGGQVVLTAPLVTHQSKISASAGGAIHLRGGVVEDDYFALAPDNGSSVYVEDTPIRHGDRKWYVGNGTVYLNVSGNEYGHLCLFGGTAVIVCGGENVLSAAGCISTQNNDWSQGTVELNGFSQVIGGINGDDRYDVNMRPLCLRNSRLNTLPTVTIRQTTDYGQSGLWTSGPMNIVKEGPATLGVAGAFSVFGNLSVNAGRLVLGGTADGSVADTVTVYAGGILSLAGRTVRCRRFELRGGVVTGGTLVADEIQLYSGTVRATLVGPVEKTEAVDIQMDMTVTGSSDIRPQYDLPEGVVAYYPFDSEERLLQDMSFYGTDLALAEGEVKFDEVGYFGGALYLNGDTWFRPASGHFPNAFPIGAEPYTVAAFIHPDWGGPFGAGWIGYGQGGAEGLANNFRMNGDHEIHNYWYARDLTVRDLGFNYYETWHHVVGTYDGVTRKIYVDGVLQVQDNPIPPDIRPVELAVGRTLNDARFKGWIDDLLVARRAFTSEEIVRLYQDGVKRKTDPVPRVHVAGGTLRTIPKERDLAICYHFDSEETLMEDSSGNGVTLKKNDGDGEPVCAVNGAFGAGSLYLAGNAVMNAASDTFPASLPVGASPYTVCAFVKADHWCSGSGGWIGYGTRQDGRCNNFRFWGGFGGIWNYWWARDIGAQIPEGTFLVTWHSVVGTFDGTTRKVFIDGIECASDESMGAPDIGDAEFAVGRTLGDAWFRGWIDELAVYTRALTQDEILAYHHGGIKTEAGAFPSDAELVIETAGTVALADDESVGKISGTGTVVGGKLIVTGELDGALRVTGDLELAAGAICVGDGEPTVVGGTVYLGEGCHVRAADPEAGYPAIWPLVSAATFENPGVLSSWVIDDVPARYDAKVEIRDGTLYAVITPRATVIMLQ